MGTTNFDKVSVTNFEASGATNCAALLIGGTSVITTRGTAPAWVNSDAPNLNTRLNALITTLTTVGIIA